MCGAFSCQEVSMEEIAVAVAVLVVALIKWWTDEDH